jgi:thiosulfate dehydrogenase
MLAPEPLSADDPKAKALYEYLLSISPEQDSGARPMTVVRNIADVPGGDAARGAKVYEAACLECHGKTHSGEGRLSERAVVLPEVVDNYAEAFPGVAPRLVVIEKIRHGQFFGVGGSMPLFTLESLSDEDVASLLAYLGL